MAHILLVMVGGALGASCRYLIALGMIQLFPKMWLPWGTVCANILGCFIIGGLSQLVLQNGAHDVLKYLFIVGFCGALTTFSSFGLEAYQLFDMQHYFRAILDVVIQVVCGFGAVILGVMVFKQQ